MLLMEKIDMFLMGEAKSGVELTPLAKSMFKMIKGWTKEEVESLVKQISSKVKDGKKYEISFDRYDKGDKTPLIINRRGDDVIKNKITPEVRKEYKESIIDLLKGTGLKITGETKVSDWLAFKVE
jgi:RNA binding exosome subunit